MLLCYLTSTWMSRSRGVLWSSNLPFLPMSKRWHPLCVSARPATGRWLRARKTSHPFFRLKSTEWITLWPPGVSVLSPASWSSVVSFLTAKNHKVGFPPPDSACGILPRWTSSLLTPDRHRLFYYCQFTGIIKRAAKPCWNKRQTIDFTLFLFLTLWKRNNKRREVLRIKFDKYRSLN